MLLRRTALLALLLALQTIPVHAQSPVAPGDTLDHHARVFVEMMDERRFAELMPEFDSTMSALLSVEKLRETWVGIIDKVGALKSIVATRRDSAPPYRIVFVTCAFSRGEFDVKLVFNRRAQVAGMFVVPTKPSDTYANPGYATVDSIRDKLVTIGASPWILHGTLTVPKRGGPFPVVILVHGSGPHDRDETVGPNKPFKDIALGLASRGVAVYRYEKRTREHASRMFSVQDGITVKEETIDDALAAVQMLRGRDEIDPHRIYMLGHSLGGMLIPRIAMLDTGIAGFIVLAGATRPMEDILLEQMEYILGPDSASSDSVRTLLATIRSQVARVKSPTLSTVTMTSSLPLSVPASYWLDLRGYKPAEVAMKINHPMLILQGGRDYQVTLDDFSGWKKSLGRRKDVQFKLYPDLNHLFFTGKGKARPAEYENAGHVALPVVQDIASWVLKGGG